MFWQLVGNGLVTGSVIAIAAVGVSLVYGILRLVNFAFGDVMAFGAFMAFLFDVTLGLPMVAATLLAMLVTAALSVAVGLILGLTTVGRTMRAVADDRALAAVAGIDTERVVVLTWVLAGLLAGLAGVLAGLVQSSFDPNFGFSLLLPTFAAVVLGGIGSAYGALAGGILLGLATELSTWSGFFGGVDPVYKPVVAFVVLIAALLVRPQGLLGRARTL